MAPTAKSMQAPKNAGKAKAPASARAKKSAKAPVPEYEYVLVGSGVAASTIATGLLEANPDTSILMLEAGPTIPMKDRRRWWDYVISWEEPYADCSDRPGDNESVGGTFWNSSDARLMIYGGSTVHWGGWSPRYRPEDFELKRNTGFGGDWPYSYKSLEPWYCRAEEYLAVGGAGENPWRSRPFPLPAYPWRESDGPMVEAMRSLDLEPGHMPLARWRKCMATGTCKYCPIGARFSGNFILDALLGNPAYRRLEFLGSAPVTRLVAEKSKRRIELVEYRDPVSGNLQQVRGKRVVLCAGAYEVPKLLMLSKSPHWKHGIGNNHDLVGRYPVSHLFLSATGTRPRNTRRWIQEYDFPTLTSRSYDTKAQQKNGKLFMMKDARHPNTDIAQLMSEGRTRAEIEKTLDGPYTVALSAYMEELGQRKNRFEVGDGLTRFGLPRTRIDFEQVPDFDDRAKKNLGYMKEILKEMGCSKIQTNVGYQAGYHTCSTARMGSKAKESVVNPDLRVHGTDNVYVCSNAVIPNCAAVNPTLTLVALTLKLVHHFQETPL
jgi:choline dehydrogenase-like flavoprotein